MTTAVNELTFYADSGSATIQAVGIKSSGTSEVYGASDATLASLQPVLAVDLSDPVIELSAFVATESVAAPAAGRRRLLQAISEAVLTKRLNNGNAAGAKSGGAAAKASPPGQFVAAWAQDKDGNGIKDALENGNGKDARLDALLGGIVGVRVVTQGAAGAAPVVREYGKAPADSMAAAALGLSKVSVNVGSGRLAGVSFFKGVGQGPGGLPDCLDGWGQAGCAVGPAGGRFVIAHTVASDLTFASRARSPPQSRRCRRLPSRSSAARRARLLAAPPLLRPSARAAACPLTASPPRCARAC